MNAAQGSILTSGTVVVKRNCLYLHGVGEDMDMKQFLQPFFHFSCFKKSSS